jgi:hypothetical protein
MASAGLPARNLTHELSRSNISFKKKKIALLYLLNRKIIINLPDSLFILEKNIFIPPLC